MASKEKVSIRLKKLVNSICNYSYCTVIECLVRTPAGLAKTPLSALGLKPARKTDQESPELEKKRNEGRSKHIQETVFSPVLRAYLKAFYIISVSLDEKCFILPALVTPKMIKLSHKIETFSIHVLLNFKGVENITL